MENKNPIFSFQSSQTSISIFKDGESRLPFSLIHFRISDKIVGDHLHPHSAWLFLDQLLYLLASVEAGTGNSSKEQFSPTSFFDGWTVSCAFFEGHFKIEALCSKSNRVYLAEISETDVKILKDGAIKFLDTIRC